MDDIVRVQIYVTDIRLREEVWKARREFFTGDFRAPPWSRLATAAPASAPTCQNPRCGRLTVPSRAHDRADTGDGTPIRVL